MVNIGTDIKSDWDFTDGDLNITNGDDNIKQAIINRVNCYDGEYQEFYYEYGSVLSNYFGFQKNTTTLEFMKIELERVLLQDPRIQEFDLDLEYTDDGVCVYLSINLNGANVDLNFVTDGSNITIINEEG